MKPQKPRTDGEHAALEHFADATISKPCADCVHSGNIKGVSELCCENKLRRKDELTADYHTAEFARKNWCDGKYFE